jgi:hypothetical protein
LRATARLEHCQGSGLRLAGIIDAIMPHDADALLMAARRRSGAST